MEDFECTIWWRQNCCSLRDCKKSAKGIIIFILFHLTIVYVVINKIIKLFFRIFKDENAIVLYIAFDPFSLINKKFAVCGLKQQDDSRLLSMSIHDALTGSGISLEELYHPTLPPTKNIGDVLRFLQVKHGNETKVVHFLIDEFNQEILTTMYLTQIHEALKSFFKKSTIVIALQSVRKDRTIHSSDKENKSQTKVIDLKSSGMKIFELTKCMRMSHQLHQLQRNLEVEIEKNHFVAPLTFKGMDSSIEIPSL